MAKVAAHSDMLPSSGRWIWKEEPLGLEFINTSPYADKGKRGKKQGSTRAGSSRRGRGGPRLTNIRPQHPKKDAVEHTTVGLNDIKTVAYDMMSEVEILPECFTGLMKAEQLDYFLRYLLRYFTCFFEKMTQEKKKNAVYMEPSLSEKKAYANAIERLEMAQKLLGRSYCVLVMGLGLDKQHHMECGHSRVSATYRDRGIYETLYNFCTFVVWITFRRKEFEVIKKEIGRMLRSDTFNPAIRVKFDTEDIKESEKVRRESLSSQKISLAEYRRMHPRRPPIQSIIHQRSPAIVSILPSPKEEAYWLFRRGRPMSSARAGMDGGMEKLEERFKDLIINEKTFKTGILGEPYNMFNPVTLTPLGAEIEDEEREGEAEEKVPVEETGSEKNQTSGFESGSSVCQANALHQSRSDHGPSRQLTTSSIATTDVNMVDEG